MNPIRLILTLFKHMPPSLLRFLAGRPLTVDGFTLDTNIQILAKLASRGQNANQMALPERRKASSRIFRALNAPRRPHIEVIDRKIKMGKEKLAIRQYAPTALVVDEKAPGILFFHQGGMVLFGLDECDPFCTILASECNARVISLDYRLAPEYKFPAAIEDARALWDYVQGHADEFNIDPSRIALAGDSAGGLMTAVLCQELKAAGGMKPAAQLLIYPWVVTNTEETGSMKSCADSFPLDRATMEYFTEHVFVDDTQRNHTRATPLNASDLSHLPPAIIAVAGFDPLRDQGNAYAKKLKAAGNKTHHYCFDALSHSFVAMGNVTKAVEKASVQIARDLLRYL